MFDSKLFRNAVSIVLVALFGFSAVLNLFGNKNVVTKIGNQKITHTDLINLGARDQKSSQVALRNMLKIAYGRNAFQELGLTISDQAIANKTKSIFSKNGQFNSKELEDSLAKANLSRAGLTNLVSHELEMEQLLFPIMNLHVPHRFINVLYKNLQKSRSGYYLELHMYDLSPEQILKYSDLSQESLTDFLLRNPNLASKKCYVFYVDKDEDLSNFNFNKALLKYKNSQAILNKGKISLIDSDDTLINFDQNTINRKTLISGIQEINGKYCVVYYNPIDDIKKLREALPYDLQFKQFAARKIAENIKTQINSIKTTKEKVQFLQNYNFEGHGFKYVEDVSFGQYFQNKRCSACKDLKDKCVKCKSNDCVCTACFNPTNPAQINRAGAISILFSKLNDTFTHIDGQSITFTVPTDETHLNYLGFSELELDNYLRSLLASVFASCAVADIEHASVSMT